MSTSESQLIREPHVYNVFQLPRGLYYAYLAEKLVAPSPVGEDFFHKVTLLNMTFTDLITTEYLTPINLGQS